MNDALTHDPTRAALTAADHTQGDTRAPHTLLEYGDYECPACIAIEPMRERLVDGEGRALRFVFRHFPLPELHPNAELAAEAAEAAAAQGKFWPMHHLLFTRSHHLALPSLILSAESLGLDMIRFKADMADHLFTQRIQEHRRSGERLGVRATPAFFLDGRAIDVTGGFGYLKAAVDAVSAAAVRRVGVPGRE